MKVLNRKQLRTLTGVNDPAEQVALLRRHGLNPFVCPITGQAKITDTAINAVMVRQAPTEFAGNMEAFE